MRSMSSGSPMSALPPKADIKVFVGMQSVSHCHKPRFLIAVGSDCDLCVLQ